MFCKTVSFLMFIVAPLVFTPAPRAEPLEQDGCIALDRVHVQGATCKALIQNNCTDPVNFSVNFDATLVRFVPNVIPARDLHADHHGEPAARHDEDAGVHSAAVQGALAAGESKWFEHTAPGDMIRMSTCKVGFKARRLE